MQKYIDQGITVLNQGGVVIFPTDTAFGIGCRIDNAEAIKRLFTIRKRPITQPTPVLLASLKMAEGYVKPIGSEVIDKLVTPFWPGALTIVLPCKTEQVPELVRGGGKTLGIRIPNHLTTLQLISSVGVPILGPSANFHGEKTPFSQNDLDPNLIKLVDYVIPGSCFTQLASTVIDCCVKPWKVVRKGAVVI